MVLAKLAAHVIVHASCTGSSHQKQAFAPLNSSNPQTTGQKGKSARKACCSLTALCTWLHMLPVQDPKTKSKQLALPVFKLQKQLFHPGKIFTVLAKLSATSNFQQFSQLYDPKTLKDTHSVGSKNWSDLLLLFFLISSLNFE